MSSNLRIPHTKGFICGLFLLYHTVVIAHYIIITIWHWIKCKISLHGSSICSKLALQPSMTKHANQFRQGGPSHLSTCRPNQNHVPRGRCRHRRNWKHVRRRWHVSVLLWFQIYNSLLPYLMLNGWWYGSTAGLNYSSLNLVLGMMDKWWQPKKMMLPTEVTFWCFGLLASKIIVLKKIFAPRWAIGLQTFHRQLRRIHLCRMKAPVLISL